MMFGPARPIAGRHVLALVVGFFFTVSAVNAAMVWLALKSFPGMVSGDPYREGLEYNRTIAGREAQRALGWRVEIAVSGLGLTRTIEASFKDRDNAPLTSLAVTASLVRPVARGADHDVALREIAPGTYRAEAEFPVAGHWRLDLEARRAAAEWHMERELWLD